MRACYIWSLRCLPYMKYTLLCAGAFLGLLHANNVIAATFNSAQSGFWDVGSTWVGGVPPTTGDKVTILNGHTVTIRTNAAVDEVIVNAGATLRGDGGARTFTYGKGGGEDFTVNGTLDFAIGLGVEVILAKNGLWGGSGTWNLSRLNYANRTLTLIGAVTPVAQVNFSGNATPITGTTGSITSLPATIWNFTGATAQTLPATANVRFGSILASNTTTVTLGMALNTTNLQGNLTVQSGTLNNGGFAIDGGGVAGKTFSVANGATFLLTGTSTMVTGFATRTFGQGTPASTPPCSTVNYAGTAQTVSIENYGNLTLSGSSTKTPAAGTMNIACNFSLAAGVTYTGTTNNPVVNLQGNFTNSGTFNSGAGVFTFNGTATQSITGITTFTNMTANNAAGLTLNNNVTVSSVLTLASGVVSAGANTLIASANCPASVVRTSGRVSGNLRLTFPATDPVTCIYHVGDSNNYAPITITKTGANSGTLTGSSTSGDHADTTGGTSGIRANRSVNRYWTLTGGSLAVGTPYSATFQFCSGVGAGCGVNDVDSGATPTSFVVAKKTGGTWTLPTVGSATATTTQATGLTTFGEFAVGERNAVDHYEMYVQTSSITCLPTTVTVGACADASSPCTALATLASGTTATLATSAGTLGSTTVTFNASGVASTTLSYPAAANGATATVTLSAEQLVAANPRKCCPDSVGCVVTDSCSTTFNTAGFIISGAADGVVATIPTQVAGVSSAPYFVRAVRTSTTTKACEAALVGANTVNFGYECNNPATCATSNLMSIDGGTPTTVARNNNGSVASFTPVSMTFDANGNAPFTFNYSDVGLVTLHVNKTVNSAPLTGVSNAFVVKPFGFLLSNIQQTAAPNLANPAAANAAGAKFVKAGESFSATVTAVTASSSATPNYGKETVAEGVTLTRTLVEPSGGASGTLANPAAFGAFSAGAATGTTFNWDEVGIITLTPSVADGDYLGVGDITGTTSGNVGRFYPDHFVVTLPSLTNRILSACAPASTFTYAGEQMQTGFTLTARNGLAVPATTTNYATTNGFAKLDGTVPANFGFGAVDLADAVAPLTAAALPLSLVSSSGTWASGAGAFTARLGVTRAASPDGPYESFRLGVLPLDSDGVTLRVADFNLDTTVPADGNDRVQVGSSIVRFGRLKLSNAHGSELLRLPIPIQAQYWEGTAFVTNTADNCTSLAAGNIGITTTLSGITATTGGAFVSGVGTLSLSKPSPTATGYADVCVDLGPDPGVGTACSAAMANRIYLQGQWAPGANYDNDPVARATYGVYKGATEFIYMRENY